MHRWCWLWLATVAVGQSRWPANSAPLREPSPTAPPRAAPTLHGVRAQHCAQRAVHEVLQREDVPPTVSLQRLAVRQPHVHATQHLGVLPRCAGAQRGVQVALRGVPGPSLSGEGRCAARRCARRPRRQHPQQLPAVPALPAEHHWLQPGVPAALLNRSCRWHAWMPVAVGQPRACQQAPMRSSSPAGLPAACTAIPP